jgi:hypothetical protein
MDFRRPMRTDVTLWFAATAVAFVALGFAHLLPPGVEGKTGPSHFWGMLVFLPTVGAPAEVFAILLFWAVVLTVAAAVAGWVIQAVIVAVRSNAGNTAPRLDHPPPGRR